MLSRRKFLEASILAQLALGSGALSLLDSCTSGETSSRLLDSTTKEILGAAMDEIVPAGDGMPSASEVGGVNYVLRLLEKLPDQVKTISTGLTDLNDRSFRKFSKEFMNVSSADRTELLIQIEKENSPFFVLLRDYTYESYYLNPKVWKLIGYESHPTLSSGPMMESFDEKLLDRVRSMPGGFKNI